MLQRCMCRNMKHICCWVLRLVLWGVVLDRFDERSPLGDELGFHSGRLPLPKKHEKQRQLDF